MKTYYDDGTTRIRSMLPEDAKILYDTYLSYGWHPQLENYENYYKEQESGERIFWRSSSKEWTKGKTSLS